MRNMFKSIICFFTLSLSLLCACSDDDTKVVNIGVQEASKETNDAGVNQMTITLKDNETKQITVHLQPTDAKNKDYNFEIVKGGVFAISNEGLITPVAIGKDSLIIHSADGGTSTTFLVKVVTHIVRVSSLTIASDALNLSLETGKTYNLASKITIAPSDATDKSLIFTSGDESIATVNANTGLVTGIKEGETVITITAGDGSGIRTESHVAVIDKYTGPLDLDRRNWTVTISVDYDYVPDGTTGLPQHMFDGDGTTFLSMVKPGKTYGGYSTPAEHELHFIVDMKEVLEFGYIKWAHREGNGNNYLRVWGIDLYGSTDGSTFNEIQKGIAIQYTDNAAPFMINLDNTAECRYVKVHITKWSDNSGGSTSGGTVQIAEVGLGNIIE